MNKARNIVVSTAMFLLQSLAPVSTVHAPGSFLQRALDASRDEPSRVLAVRQLHGTMPHDRDDVARALVPLLNEPLWWLPSEALSFIALASRTLIGVRHGRFVACATPRGMLIGDASGAAFCPELGRVVVGRELLKLAREARVSLPWLLDERSPVVNHHGWL